MGGNYGSDADMNLFTIADANVVYEFHFCDPNDYTFNCSRGTTPLTAAPIRTPPRSPASPSSG